MVAFIRRVRTASGATAVQVVEYAGGRRQRVLAHVGSAHDAASLGVLMARARALLEDPAQGALELEVEPSAPVASMVPAPAPAGLVPEVLPAAAGPAPARVAPGTVSQTVSRLLYEALSRVYADLGFESAADRVFRDLVIARLVEATSLLDSGRVLRDLGVRPASYSTMKRTLARAHEGGYRDRLAAACFAHASTGGDLSLVLYDVTTLYFEAEREDDLRKVGYSKERRVDPQIVVGLLVDRAGFPLHVACYEGNKAEQATIVPAITAFQDAHGVADMVVVADAGMLSAANLKALDAAGMRFIVGSRQTKAPADLESHFHWHGDAFTDGQLIDTISPRHGRSTRENTKDKRAEPVWDPKKHVASWRAVWAYSARRAARDGKTLTAQENRAKAVVAGEKADRTPRFVKTTNGAKSLDEASLARARRLAGLKGYVTNIPAATMPAAEVISSYHDLWQVEASFRMSKTDLRARPIFHHTKDAIEAHLTIVFAALAVAREAQERTGLAIRNIVRQLRPLRSATLTINSATHTYPPQIPQPQAQILADLLRPKNHALSD